MSQLATATLAAPIEQEPVSAYQISLVIHASHEFRCIGSDFIFEAGQIRGNGRFCDLEPAHLNEVRALLKKATSVLAVLDAALADSKTRLSVDEFRKLTNGAS